MWQDRRTQSAGKAGKSERSEGSTLLFGPEGFLVGGDDLPRPFADTAYRHRAATSLDEFRQFAFDRDQIVGHTRGVKPSPNPINAFGSTFVGRPCAGW